MAIIISQCLTHGRHTGGHTAAAGVCSLYYGIDNNWCIVSMLVTCVRVSSRHKTTSSRIVMNNIYFKWMFFINSKLNFNWQERDGQLTSPAGCYTIPYHCINTLAHTTNRIHVTTNIVDV